MIGRTLSHHRIEAELGAGGMGVVYRARDLHLDRDVALKVLPPDLLEDEVARQRFRREALALSRLQHPHINVVHDFDVQEGIPFLVMELVPGTTLAERIGQGPLPENEVIRLGLEIARALEAAHQAGVLHRDLKPGNVMVTPRGEANVLDFGLAKRLPGAVGSAESTLSRTLTETQALTGTLPYMAPELLMGREADARTDLYALGVTLYEMATGKRPHADAQHFELAGAILHRSPASPRKLRPELSLALEAIVLKCLAKDPAQRYANAGELIADLSAPAEAAATRARRRKRLGVVVSASLAVLAAIAGSALLTRVLLQGRQTIRSLVVLPLENLSNDPDQEYFVDGMTDELITTLAQVQGITVISRSSAMEYKKSRKPLRQIARELGVQAVIEGAVRRAGDQVRISARLVDARSNRNLWAQTYQRGLADVLSLQGDLALTIAGQIRLSLTPDLKARLATRRKVNPEAHEACLKGQSNVSQYTRESFRRALEYFQRAIDIDPTYAEAHAGLSNTYYSLSSIWLPASEAMPRARAAAIKALDLDPQLASAHASLATVEAFYDWRWSEAENEFRRAIELNPSEPTAHQNYGNLLVIHRRFQEAERELQRAHEIDPLSPLISFYGLFPANLGRDYPRAIEQGLRVITQYPDFSFPHLILGQAYFFNGDRQRGMHEIDRAFQLEANPGFLAWKGYMLAASGHPQPARQLLGRIEAMAETTYVQPYFRAIVHAGLGENDRAFEWLNKAIEERNEEVQFLQVDPAMDPLRSDPRFSQLLKQVGFKP